MARGLRRLLRELKAQHGAQQWWPAETDFEVVAGAVLTQNTAWRNVERALDNLRANDALSLEGVLSAHPRRLASWLRPSGYYNLKTRRLRNLCRWLLAQGGLAALAPWETARLRAGLLGVNGVGPETADDILLYALGRPVFVVDAYTRRLFSRLGLAAGTEPYEALRQAVEEALGGGLTELQEFHALIVTHAKEICRPRPRCGHCRLRRRCNFAAAGGNGGP